MEDLFFLLCINFIIDFSVLLFVNKINRLNLKIFSIFILQILTISASVIFYYLDLKYFMLILIKFVAYFIICLLIAKSYKFSSFVKLYLSFIIFYFSIFGFINFETKVIDLSFPQISRIFQNENLTLFAEIVGLVIYLYLIYITSSMLSKHNFKKNYISHVSFYMFDKHIRLRGLLDSGNSLYDTVTGKPVIIVAKNAFEKCFYDKLNDIKVLRQIDCVVIGNETINLPIVGITNVQISSGKNSQVVSCAIGISNQTFGFGGSFNPIQLDCLLHRDFL